MFTPEGSNPLGSYAAKITACTVKPPRALELAPAVVLLASWAGGDLDVALASLDPHVVLVAEAVAEPLGDHAGFR